MGNSLRCQPTKKLQGTLPHANAFPKKWEACWYCVVCQRTADYKSGKDKYCLQHWEEYVLNNNASVIK